MLLKFFKKKREIQVNPKLLELRKSYKEWTSMSMGLLPDYVYIRFFNETDTLSKELGLPIDEVRDYVYHGKEISSKPRIRIKKLSKI
jgi:hypothetical protein